MPRVTLRMPSAQGVGAGQTATFRLPIGRTYHNLLLTYSGVTLAQMTEIRLVVNGKTQRRITGGDWQDSLNKFVKHAAANGVLRIDLDRSRMRLKGGEEFTAIGTGVQGDPQQITTMSLEIDIDAGAAAPALALKAIQSDPSPAGMISKLREFSYAPSAGGDYEIADLPKGDLIGRIYFRKAGINSVKIERDGFVVFERTAAENSLIQTDGERAPQADVFIFDPSELGFAGEQLATAGVQDLRITVNVAAGGAMPVVVEYIGPLGD